MTQDASDQEVYARLAERLGASGTGYMPQIMSHAANPRQARILAQLNQAPLPPKRVGELAQALGLEAQTVVEDLELLFKRGLAFPRDLQKREEWRFARSLGQIHDSMQCERGTYTPADKERLHELWRLFDEGERFEKLAEVARGLTASTHRIVPAVRSVADNPELQPWEDWREILKQQELISVVNCPCRPKMKNCHKPVEVCMDFNRASEYDLASGHGRQLTYDEALEVLAKAAEGGLVHILPNTQQVFSLMSMCNCCDDCCYSVVPLKMANLPFNTRWSKSRYQAKVNQDTCNGCQDCVEKCMFDALSVVNVPGSRRLKAQVNPDNCFGCGLCFVACASEAIAMECVRPPEHVPAAVSTFKP